MAHGLTGPLSTAPVRSTDTTTTADPPDLVAPIYYPLSPSERPNPNAVPAEVLLTQFMERHTAMDYPAAAEAAYRLRDAIPDRPEGHYNLACVLCKLHRTQQALSALEAAVKNGWRDVAHLKLDPDLMDLHRESAYQSLVARLEERVAQERTVPGPLRTEPWERVSEDLQRSVAAMLSSQHVTGASVALIRDGKVVWSSAFGERDRRTGQALEAGDAFRVRPPLHLLAVLACEQLQASQHTSVAQVLAQGLDVAREGAVASSGGRSVASAPSGASVTTVGLQQRGAGRSGSKASLAPSYQGESVYGFLRLWIETASSQSFNHYCTEHIFRPLGLTDVSVDVPSDAGKPVAVGHGALGSPMDLPADARQKAGNGLLATAGDLAELIAATMRDGSLDQRALPGDVPETSATNTPSPGMTGLEQFAKLNSMIPGGLGLAVQSKQTECGSCIELADSFAGMGCLIRWYPGSRNGVVVLYNSANGHDAACRIAHLALGGV